MEHPTFYRPSAIKTALILSIVFFSLSFYSCSSKHSGKDAKEKAGIRQVLVFVPGTIAGSAVYEMLTDGVKSLAEEREDIAITVIEAGTDQSTWENQLTALAASGKYELIVSSNPSLPEIAALVAEKFPQQRFILMDGELEGNSSIQTFHYDQREQAWLAGYLAALATVDAGKSTKNIALIAGQEYPAMNTIILPWFEQGAKAVDKNFKVDFRIVGNWYDATRALELAHSAIRAGSYILMPIAGGANQGVLQAASETGNKVIWFDNDGFDKKPGTVIGSSMIYQAKAARELVNNYLNGFASFGTSQVGAMSSGYIDFLQDHPVYRENLSEESQQKIAQAVTFLKAGGSLENIQGAIAK